MNESLLESAGVLRRARELWDERERPQRTSEDWKFATHEGVFRIGGNQYILGLENTAIYTIYNIHYFISSNCKVRHKTILRHFVTTQ